MTARHLAQWKRTNDTQWHADHLNDTKVSEPSMIALLEMSTVCQEVKAQSDICGFVLGVRVKFSSLQTEVMGKEC